MRCKPVFLTFGGNAVYLGSDVGHASALDNALLVVLWGTMFGVLQGVSICEAEGFPLAACVSSLKTIMPVVDASSTDLVARIDEGRLAGDETTAATVEVCRASIRYLLELSKEHGTRRAMLDAFDQIFEAAIKVGHAQDDFAVLSKFMR